MSLVSGLLPRQFEKISKSDKSMKVTDRNFKVGHDKLMYAKQIWQLKDDGDIFKTATSLLQPVIYKGIKAMLKIPFSAEEARGAFLMICWDGNGSAQILEHDKNALLMERAVGARSLKQMVIDGDEDKANKIVCDLVSKLHATGCKQIPELVPLPVWFRALRDRAEQYGGILANCNEIAGHLINSETDTVALHGDIHYDNILDSENQGWIAIDPKGLLGDRAFDYANIFCNPDFTTAASPVRLSKQVRLIAGEAALDPQNLLKWVIAWAGLSATWILGDGEDASLPLTVARIAVEELGGC